MTVKQAAASLAAMAAARAEKRAGGFLENFAQVAAPDAAARAGGWLGRHVQPAVRAWQGLSPIAQSGIEGGVLGGLGGGALGLASPDEEGRRHPFRNALSGAIAGGALGVGGQAIAQGGKGLATNADEVLKGPDGNPITADDGHQITVGEAAKSHAGYRTSGGGVVQWLKDHINKRMAAPWAVSGGVNAAKGVGDWRGRYAVRDAARVTDPQVFRALLTEKGHETLRQNNFDPDTVKGMSDADLQDTLRMSRENNPNYRAVMEQAMKMKGESYGGAQAGKYRPFARTFTTKNNPWPWAGEQGSVGFEPVPEGGIKGLTRPSLWRAGSIGLPLADTIAQFMAGPSATPDQTSLMQRLSGQAPAPAAVPSSSFVPKAPYVPGFDY